METKFALAKRMTHEKYTRLLRRLEAGEVGYDYAWLAATSRATCPWCKLFYLWDATTLLQRCGACPARQACRKHSVFWDRNREATIRNAIIGCKKSLELNRGVKPLKKKKITGKKGK